MSTKQNIQKNLNIIKEKIHESCLKIGRDPSEITLVAVTKTFPASVVRVAAELGINHVGENKVQEALPKQEELNDLPIQWHFIGHLQSNKAKFVVGKFHLIQSVDSLKLAKELQKQAEKREVFQDVLVEVNCSGEPSKFGIDPEDTLNFLEQLASFSRLRIKGLMTIGKLTEDESEIREGFHLLKNLFEKAKLLDIENMHMEFLSMGMTNDFQLAIEEGSNMIRIGRGLFGERNYS